MNQDAMRVESCSRMIALGLPSSVIDEFKENNKLYCSDAGGFVEVPAKILERVIEWQKVSKWIRPQLCYKWTGKKFKKQ